MIRSGSTWAWTGSQLLTERRKPTASKRQTPLFLFRLRALVMLVPSLCLTTQTSRSIGITLRQTTAYTPSLRRETGSSRERKRQRRVIRKPGA